MTTTFVFPHKSSRCETLRLTLGVKATGGVPEVVYPWHCTPSFSGHPVTEGEDSVMAEVEVYGDPCDSGSGKFLRVLQNWEGYSSGSSGSVRPTPQGTLSLVRGRRPRTRTAPLPPLRPYGRRLFLYYCEVDVWGKEGAGRRKRGFPLILHPKTSN